MGDHLPPSDLDAERALLGTLLHATDAVDHVLDDLTVDALYQPAHQTIYAAILDLYAAGDPVDVITVKDHLHRGGNLNRCGGGEYLLQLHGEARTVVNLGYYAEIINRKATKRRAVELGQRIRQLAETDDEPDLAERIEDLAQNLSRGETRDDETIPLSQAVDEMFTWLDAPSDPVLSTGLYDIDELLTGGLMPGAVYIVAARPGHGKSLFAGCVALNVAQAGVGVVLATLEMPRVQIAQRLTANLAGVNLTKILRKRLDPPDVDRVKAARYRLEELPLAIRDTPALTPAALRRLAERHVRRPPHAGLIVVDYVQHMTATDPRLPRHEQLAEISRSVKTLAMRLEVPIILLSQTNRESRHRATPDASDLRESGSLEADADVVMILKPPDEEPRLGELDVHVVKNRHGPQGRVTLAYAPSLSRVQSLAKP